MTLLNMIVVGICYGIIFGIVQMWDLENVVGLPAQDWKAYITSFLIQISLPILLVAVLLCMVFMKKRVYDPTAQEDIEDQDAVELGQMQVKD